MNGQPPSAPDRLDSWKDIAAYLRRGVRTLQRWEREAALPIRRVGRPRGAIYAFRGELDAWWRQNAAHSSEIPRSPAAPRAAALGTVGPDVARATGSMPVRPFLSQSVIVDPESAAAHANLAVYFFTLVVTGLMDPDDGMPAVRGAAQRALALDGTAAAEANTMLALVAALYDSDWAAAALYFELALAGPRVPPTVRFHYATWFLSPLGRHEEALHQLGDGLKDEPLYLLGRVQVAVEYLCLGETARGRRLLEDVLALDAGFGPALGLLGRELAVANRLDEAAALAERTYSAIPRHPNAVGFKAGLLQRQGDVPAAGALLASLKQESAWAVARARAEASVIARDDDGAVAWIEAAINQNDPGIWLVLTGTPAVAMRRNARWPTVARRLRLPADLPA